MLVNQNPGREALRKKRRSPRSLRIANALVLWTSIGLGVDRRLAQYDERIGDFAVSSLNRMVDSGAVEHQGCGLATVHVDNLFRAEGDEEIRHLRETDTNGNSRLASIGHG